MLYLERKRAERSGRSFVLMLLESTGLLGPGADREAFQGVLDALSRSTRDTDITGWYKDRAVIGVIFTELSANTNGKSVAKVLLNKVSNALASVLDIQQINQISLSFHVFPEDWDERGPAGRITASLYDDMFHEVVPSRVSLAVKRLMDIAGSLAALILSSPLLLAAAIAVKLTSRGPVLFRQERLGQYGRKFVLLKFRSMKADNDHSIHRKYTEQFIAGENHVENASGNQPCYKLTADPRITRLGRFLRKTSLDEFPQFFNVLKGEMSLVGPRPPIPYEAACYATWHRARLLAAKPGITGLWQVGGRSQVKFDDMVRLDLQYARSWSIWMDLKILLQTPAAVLTANGAH
jgi:lipopolysaccharide/colanic/teichoic acid biosynthesis glycosyltransferase